MGTVQTDVALRHQSECDTRHLTVRDTRGRLRVPCPVQPKGYVHDGDAVFTGAGVCTLPHQRSVEEPWTSPWMHPYRRHLMIYWSS